MTEQPGSHSGQPPLGETVRWAALQYRSHLELVYPLAVFGLVSLLLDIRVELLSDLFTLDDSFGIEADTELLSSVLSEPVARVLAPVLEEVFVLLVLGVLGLFALVAMVFFVVVGIVFLLVADERSGTERLQFGRTVVAVKRLPAVLGASIVAIPLIVLGSVFLVIPGLYLFTRFALGAPAIVVDGHGPIEGLRVSWRRTDEQFVEVFLTAVVGLAVVAAVGFVPVVGELVSVFLLLPTVALTLGVLYVDSG